MPRMFACALALSIALLTACATSHEVPDPRLAAEAHLAAVAARDMDALLPTVTSGPSLTLIFPNGERLETRQAFIDFHRDWFSSDDGGLFEAEIIDMRQTAALSHVLVRYRYTARRDNGEVSTNASWLALTFALENGSWRLVFDQNTRIAPQPPS